MTYFFNKKFDPSNEKLLNRFTLQQLVLIAIAKRIPLKKIIINYLLNVYNKT